MTWSAPRDRTRSTFVVLHTRGDLRAERLGQLHGVGAHAAGRTDDQHPLARPGPARGRARPAARSSPETATTAACSKVRFAGLGASLLSGARAYSAKVPLPMPNTSSPGCEPGHAVADRLHDARRGPCREPGSSAPAARSPRDGSGTAGRSSRARRPGPRRPRARAPAPRRGRSPACRCPGARRTSAEPYDSPTIALMARRRRASRRPARRRGRGCALPKRTVSGPPNGWRSTTSSASPRRDAALVEVAQHLGVGVRDADELAAVARLQLGQAACRLLVDVAGRRRGSGRRADRASGCRASPRSAPRGPRR